ncbi:MAG: J domain-containing protein [Terracidiphilus sp.]
MCGNPADTFGGLCERCASLQTLGLGENASAAEIESAYLTLVKVWHPDRFQSDLKLKRAAEEKLKEINTAHDYLTSEHPTGKQRPAAPDPEPTPEPEEPPTPVFVAETMGEEPEARQALNYGLKILLKIVVVTGAIALFALLWISLDSFLLENSKTAGPWGEFKAEFSREIHASALRLWTNATQSTRGSKTENALPPAPPPTQDSAPVHVPPANAETPVDTPVATAPRAVHGAKPYITSGLTPMEVLSILGNPTSSSGEKMFYKGSEIDFKNGHVAGWNIDPKTSPLRVKLWPNTAPVPGLTTFAAGSSKSDVISVQGTPTLFSDNEFGYGGSRVFFQNDRVVGWSEDPSSVRLRVAH